MADTVVVVEVVPRRDGKRYPAAQLSRADLNRLRRLEHQLVHADRLSIRQCQAALLADHHVRRSVGAIARDLGGWECPSCDEAAVARRQPPEPPPQPPPPPQPEPWPWIGACPQ